MAEQPDFVTEAWRPAVVLLGHPRATGAAGQGLPDLEDYLRDTAGIDPVTGLDSRRRFDSRLTQELKRAARSGHPTAVAVFELRPLRSLGADRVADVLVRASVLLQAELRDIDTVARLEGARFAALLPMCDAASAHAAVNRAIQLLVGLGGVSPVAGVASTEGTNGWELLDSAEVAAGRLAEPLALATAGRVAIAV